MQGNKTAEVTCASENNCLVFCCIRKRTRPMPYPSVERKHTQSRSLRSLCNRTTRTEERLDRECDLKALTERKMILSEILLKEPCLLGPPRHVMLINKARRSTARFLRSTRKRECLISTAVYIALKLTICLCGLEVSGLEKERVRIKVSETSNLYLQLQVTFNAVNSDKVALRFHLSMSRTTAISLELIFSTFFQ